MDDILDELEKNEPKEIVKTKIPFSIYSFIISFFTSIALTYFVTKEPLTFDPFPNLFDKTEPSFLVTFALGILPFIGFAGIYFTYKSLDERSNWFKWIGGSLNVVLFIFIAGLYIYTMNK